MTPGRRAGRKEPEAALRDRHHDRDGHRDAGRARERRPAWARVARLAVGIAAAVGLLACAVLGIVAFVPVALVGGLLRGLVVLVGGLIVIIVAALPVAVAGKGQPGQDEAGAAQQQE